MTNIAIVVVFGVLALLVEFVTYIYIKAECEKLGYKQLIHSMFTTLKKDKKSLIWKYYKEVLILALCLILSLIIFCNVIRYNIDILSTLRIVTAVYILLFSSLVDGYLKKIPNVAVGAGLIIRTLIFIPEYFVYEDSFKEVLIASLIGVTVSFGVLIIMSFVTRGGFGMGDVKLLSFLGYDVGLTAVLSTFLFGMIVCMVYSIYLLVFEKMKKKDTVPFGPFIYIGFLIVILVGIF